VFYITLDSHKVSAAACTSVGQYGAVRLQVPELPYTGKYALWVRMQSPEPVGKLLIEVNQSDCYELNDVELISGQWKWVSYKTNGKLTTLQLDQLKNYSLKVIGISLGLKVDSVILSEPECIPQDLGNNCNVAAIAKTSQASDVLQLPPPSQQSVSGTVVLSQTPRQYAAQLKSLQYTVNGQTIQRSSLVTPFDTTLLSDGTHTILITTNLQDGTVLQESTNITVDNPTNAMSPVIRWARLRQATLITSGLILGSIVLATVLAWVIHHWYIKRRERHFHGF
ncbi:MAG: hypothetical protein M3Q14_01550, partial [bacterium]|nr:hypothetical protein [bacterium]